jgi:hypothetical protein
VWAYLCAVCDAHTSAVSCTVPVGLWVTQTISNGNSFVAELSKGRKHILSQVIGRLVEDVMTNGEPFVTLLSSSTVLCDKALESVFRRLNFFRCVLVIVIGVNVEVGDVIAEISHVLLTTRRGSAARVRRTHVCWDFSEDVSQGHLVHPHLVLAIEGGNLAEVEMRPSVGSNLVTFRVYTFDNICMLDINLALVDVGSSHEEGGLGVVALQEVKDVIGEGCLGTIIVRKSHSARCFTLKDAITAIWDRANLVTRNRRGVRAGRGVVFRASRTILVITSW